MKFSGKTHIIMHADNWAIKAKQMGYRSRAVFKLEEILNKTKTKKS